MFTYHGKCAAYALVEGDIIYLNGAYYSVLCTSDMEDGRVRVDLRDDVDYMATGERSQVAFREYEAVDLCTAETARQACED